MASSSTYDVLLFLILLPSTILASQLSAPSPFTLFDPTGQLLYAYSSLSPNQRILSFFHISTIGILILVLSFYSTSSSSKNMSI